MDDKYKELTKEKIETALKDIMYDNKEKKRKLILWAIGYEDKDGNIKCGFLEEFDKAMKEEIKKTDV